MCGMCEGLTWCVCVFRDCAASDSCSESGVTDASTAACDAAGNLPYDPRLNR